MKNYINGGGNAFENDVTWSTTYPAPYNTESYSDGAITRSAAALYFAGGSVYYLDNHFIPS
jgi:hypothetical protein